MERNLAVGLEEEVQSGGSHLDPIRLDVPRQSDWHPCTRAVSLLKPRPPLTQHTQSGPQGMQTDTHMVPIGQFGCL